MSDRLSIEKKYVSGVIEKIDDTGFLDFDIHNAERIDLFMFALGLGVKAGIRTPLANSHGLILATAVENKTEAASAIYSLLVEEARKENQEDKIDDRDLAFEIAEEYANTGFKMISDWLNQKEQPNIYRFIKEMDEQYEKIGEAL